jgi:hypothetical protein
MSFELKITFTGLFLFVPEPGSQRMHVLLPKSPHGPMQHIPCLYYDQGYKTGGPLGTDPLAQIALDDHVLDLSGYAGVIDPKLPNLVNLNDITNDRIAPDRIDKDIDDRLTSRIELAAGSAYTEATGRWDLVQPTILSPPASPVARMAWWMEWTIPDTMIGASQLDLMFTELHKAPTQKPVTLHPKNGYIELHARHLMAGEPIPTAGNTKPTGLLPPPGFTADHFRSYYKVYLNPLAGRDTVPAWRGDGNSDGEWGEGAPYTCMIGGGYL